MEGKEFTSSWEQLAKDMEVALNRVYVPVRIQCKAYEHYQCIEYQPPFYVKDKNDRINYAVKVKCGEKEEPKYPLTCTSGYYKDVFIVESPHDWENHGEKFVAEKCKIEDLKMFIGSL